MDDLFAMLGIDEAAAGCDGPGPDDPFDGARTPGPAFTNHNAVEVDRWAARRGLDLLAADPALGVDGHAAADFSAVAFEVKPRLLPGCVDGLKHRFLAELLDSPAYRDAHRSTMLDGPAAQLAALEYARAFAALKAAHPAGVPGDHDGDRAVAAAARSGAERGAEEVEVYVGGAAGCGLDPARRDARLDPKAAARVYRRVKDSPRLRTIMDLAGKFRRLAQGKQRLRPSHGVGEVCDLTLGGEIERLVPAELARFALPGTVLDEYRRVLQRQALQKEHHAHTPEGRGPVVVVVDESGSMSQNAKIERAKGLALALAWVARSQNRWCCLYSFGMGPVTHGVVLPPGRWDEEALLTWLERFMKVGGTDLRVLCETVPGMWDGLVRQGMARGKTDVILITDGQVHNPDNLPEFLAWKAKERVRVLSVVIEAGSGYGGVDAVSDAVHPVWSLTPDSPAAAAVVNIG